MASNILNKDFIRGGDVLLGYSSELREKSASIQSGYSHAAICISDSCILESSRTGVAITNIDKLLEDYGHIAVLRSDGLWSESRLKILSEFASENVGKKFNHFGIGKKYEARKKEHQNTAMKLVQGYFSGVVPPAPSDREIYFCSELITSAFIRAKVIDESASVLFAPETFSPEDIGKDKAFGFFVGYIIPYAEYKIPENDMFENSV